MSLHFGCHRSRADAWPISCFVNFQMAKTALPGAQQFVPKHPTLSLLSEAAQSCRGCQLYRAATQAVLGDGSAKAGLMLVGEQPGNDEDLQGRPFVGPAGRMLDRALEEAGIDRGDVYVTNAVKHFKFEERGKRRIHKKPSAAEVGACRPWLETEINLVRPKLIGCLGATAAQSLLGSAFRITKERGRPVEHGSWRIVATVHPSAILRAPEREQRHLEYSKFVTDLKAMRKLLQE